MADPPHSKRPAAPPRSSQRSVCGMLVLLSRMDHYVLRSDPVCRLLVAQRTPLPFQEISEIEACFDQVERTLASLPRHQYVLLVDVRLGPARNDGPFEEAVAKHRGKLLLGFAKNAALASMAAGRLQIQRYAKADGREVLVTDSPEAAFEHLGVPDHML